MSEKENSPNVNSAQESQPIQQTTSTGCCRRNPYHPVCRYTMVIICLTTTAFLVVGMFAPGWLRVHRSLEVAEGYTNRDFGYYYKVHQDYGLWSITQCKLKQSDRTYTCETRSYAFISGFNEGDRIAQIQSEDVEFSDATFDGVALIFSFKLMWVLQALYVIGTLIAVFNIFLSFQLHGNPTVRFCSAINQQNVIAFSFVPAILILITVFVFVAKDVSLSGDGSYSSYDDDAGNNYGIIFAGIGGSGMFMYSLFMLIHTRVCQCAESEDYETQGKFVDEEENQQREQLCEA